LKIVASNDINEAAIKELNSKNHAVDMFGIGTNLVTCQAQPALGMVYKVCEFKGTPRIKLSEEPSKTTIAGAKSILRAFSEQGEPIFDILCMKNEFESILANPQSLTTVYDRLTKEAKAASFARLEPISEDLFTNGQVTFEQLSLKQRQAFAGE